MTSRRTYERIARNLPFPRRKERVAVIYLGSRGAKLTQFVGGDGAGTARFDIGDVVARAQRVKAAGIVLVHNHPSGALRASPQDRKVTRDLAQACQAAGVDLVDHLVHAGGKVQSIMGPATVSRETPATVSDVPHRGMDHRKEVHIIARRIRKDGEEYPQALKRAWQQMKESPHWTRATLPEPTGQGTVPPERVRSAVKKVARRVPPIQKRATPPAPPAKRVKPKAGPPEQVGAGNTTTATGADPSKVYEFRYRVLPMELVVASHNDDLSPNPRFPKELQPRLRDRAASRLQIRTMAQNLDPKALIMDFHTLDRGPMIVGPADVLKHPVESGNGRTLALRLAQQDFPDKWKEYQDLLRKSVAEFGIDPGDLKQLARPVLVRERLTDVDRVAFAEEANAATVMQMSPLELALQDARHISDEDLADLQVSENQSADEALTSTVNKPLVSAWLRKLPSNEQAALVTSTGTLNQVGLQRLKAALFAKVYPGDAGMRLTRAFIESLDPVLKNVEAAMFDSLPQMARAESLARTGERVADLGIGSDLANAIDVLAGLKQSRTTANDYVRQQSFVDRRLTPMQERLLLFLEEFGRSRKGLRTFMRDYAQAVIASPHPQQGAMFAQTQESKSDLVERLSSAQSKKASSGGLWDLIETRERLGMVADPARRFPHWSRAGGKRRKVS